VSVGPAGPQGADGQPGGSFPGPVGAVGWPGSEGPRGFRGSLHTFAHSFRHLRKKTMLKLLSASCGQSCKVNVKELYTDIQGGPESISTVSSFIVAISLSTANQLS